MLRGFSKLAHGRLRRFSLALLAAIVPAPLAVAAFVQAFGTNADGILAYSHLDIPTVDNAKAWLNDPTYVPALQAAGQHHSFDNTADEAYANTATSDAFVTAGNTLSLSAHAYSSNTQPFPLNLYATHADAVAYASDVLSATPTVNYTYTRHGLSVTATAQVTATLSGDSHSLAILVLRLTDGSGHTYVGAEAVNSIPSIDVTVTVPPTDGTIGPNFIKVEQFLYAETNSGLGGGTGNAEINAQLGISNIVAPDDNNVIIPGLKIFGDSGAAYPYDAATPEPTALSLVALTGFALLRRRRRIPPISARQG